MKEQDKIAKRLRIAMEIDEERARQDEQWGGSEHDDGHTTYDWCRFIEKQIKDIYDAARPSVSPLTSKQLFNRHREKLLKIASLAVAAIESTDRKMQR